MISNTANHQLWNRIKSQFRRFASKNICNSTEDIRRRHSGEVSTKRKERHGGFGFIPSQEIITESTHSLSRIDGIILLNTNFFQDILECSLHMNMISRIQKQLHLFGFHQWSKRFHILTNELPLRSCSPDRNQDTTWFEFRRCGTGNSSCTILGNVLDEVTWDPMSCELNIFGRDAHFEKVLIIHRSLYEIQAAGYNDEPLRMVINDEVDDFGEPRSDGCKSDIAVSGNNGCIEGNIFEQRTKMYGGQSTNTKRITISREHGFAPCLLDDSSNVGGDT
mmetsp:Transcript_14900/g.22330  ORF Transcript_14900/g.22330 Transcript_14900/m.22330 type:complete len:278 (+) Transcript_14900:340-1173(+)